MDNVTADGQMNDSALEEERARVLAAREKLGQDLDRLDAEVRTQVSGGVQKAVWKLAAGLAGLAAGAVVRKGLTAAWRRTRNTEPPDDPLDPAIPWTDALAWTVATAVGVGIARLLAERGAAAGWRKAMGTPPPGAGG